jgi:hypothetical protein
VVETLLAVWLSLSAPASVAAADSTAPPTADPSAASPRAPAADTSTARPRTPAADLPEASPRIVRRFPPIEVHALLHDMRSSETVHLVPGSALRTLPVDGLADVLALQPGVVAQAEELHVRGGRAGETAVSLDGMGLNEPLRYRAMDVPLLALRDAELVSGAPEAQHGGGLAGVLVLHTLDPGERPSAEWRWQSDGRTGTRFDRVSARADTPLLLGLGVVAAGDVTLDDTWLPRLRTPRRQEVAGLSFGWRAENRLLGALKLAPVRQPERFSAQVFASRQVHQPYSPNWSRDGWVLVPENLKSSPVFSPVPLPGYLRYRAADHLAITDERRLAALLSASVLRPMARASLRLAWQRSRGVTSTGGGHEDATVSHHPRYGNADNGGGFYALWGDYPLYRETASDVVTLSAEGEAFTRAGARLLAGAGLTYDEVSLREMDWMPYATRAFDPGVVPPLDSVRTYWAGAPGAFAYLQGRWASGGMVLNAGLRAEYWTPGEAATRQTLPGSASGVWSFGPRFGIAYPISVRDVFSLSYVRLQQPPARDHLYDQRTAISDRQPLGNPAIRPATLISYQGAVKHLFSAEWALQTSVFYRDVFDQVGARDAADPIGTINLRYIDEDQSSAAGIEWSLIHARGERTRVELHYTWMQAWGNESRPEGDPYGPVRSADTPPIGDQPVSWDRRHSLQVAGAWQWRHGVALAWSTAVGSPLPWTPKPRRQVATDLAAVNSRRLGWTENTDLRLQWTPARARGLGFGLEARNLFDHRGDRAATLDGYPNPLINTVYDDYGAYRTETGLGGGAYWWTPSGGGPGQWVPVHDARLMNPPRTVRASIGVRW